MTDLPKTGDVERMEALIRSMLPDGARISGYDDGPTETGLGKTAVHVELRNSLSCFGAASIWSTNGEWVASTEWSPGSAWSGPIRSADELRALLRQP